MFGVYNFEGKWHKRIWNLKKTELFPFGGGCFVGSLMSVYFSVKKVSFFLIFVNMGMSVKCLLENVLEDWLLFSFLY